MILNNKVSKPEIVASKAKEFFLETVGNFQIDENKLETEHKWLGSLKGWVREGRLLIHFGRLEFQKRNFQNGGK